MLSSEDLVTLRTTNQHQNNNPNIYGVTPNITVLRWVGLSVSITATWIPEGSSALDAVEHESLVSDLSEDEGVSDDDQAAAAAAALEALDELDTPLPRGSVHGSGAGANGRQGEPGQGGRRASQSGRRASSASQSGAAAGGGDMPLDQYSTDDVAVALRTLGLSQYGA